MSELQATIEFSVELHKFYNVDLFQRGFYQVRCNLRSSPKVPSKVEVSLPRTRPSPLSHPPSIVDGTAVSKTFQILYRNEEVLLDDVIQYRVHILLDSARLEETLQAAQFCLDVELWFTEDGAGMEQHSSVTKVSYRTLQLAWGPGRGIHYHLPVLFDYFHLSCVSVTVHGALLSLHQPYLPSPRPSTRRPASSRSSSPCLSTMESVLFGPTQLGVKYGTSRTRLAIAGRIYQEVCTLLLQALESLQCELSHLGGLLPDLQRPEVTRPLDCRQRMKRLVEIEAVQSEEDFLTKANSDISQLCAENILLWNKFLDAFTLRDVVREHLACINHRHRLRRFSEGFFTMSNPKKSALCCLEVKHSHHSAVSEAVRRSQYFSTLPDLSVSCRDLDGGPDTLPIIFEDVYSDSSVPRRYSGYNGDWAGLHSSPSCVLHVLAREKNLPSTPRPASVPGQLDQGQFSALELLGEELGVLANQQQQVGKDRKNVRKKISLPAGGVKETVARGVGLQRKASVDSSLGSSLSPTLSPDMKGFFKEKLRNMKPRRGKGREGKEAKGRCEEGSKEDPDCEGRGGRKGESGYSHLDCCADVPYNLAEEPEQVDGVSGSRVEEHTSLDCSFTSTVLRQEERGGPSVELMRTAVREQENREVGDEVVKEERLEGMAAVRQIVLAEKERREGEREERREGDREEVAENHSDSSLGDSSGQGSNSSRLSTSSVCSSPPRQPPLTPPQHLASPPLLPPSPPSPPLPLGSLSSPLLKTGVTSTTSPPSSPQRQEGRPPALPSSCSPPRRPPLAPPHPSLRSPLLLLGQSMGRSRSEEPQAVTEPLPRRPRHRSESLGAGPPLPPSLPTPPEAFRDLPAERQHLLASRLEEGRGSSPRLEEVRGSSSLLEEDRTSSSRLEEGRGSNSQLKDDRTSSSRQEVLTCRLEASSLARLRRAQFSEARSNSVLSSPGLREEQGRRGVDERKIIRSNTISRFSSEGREESGEQKVAEKLAELRLGRKGVVAREEGEGEEGGEGSLMEHKSLPQRQGSVALTPAPGFSCCDWLPHKSLLIDERLLQKVAYSQGPGIVQFLRDREQFTRQTSFPGRLYSHLALQASRPYFLREPVPDTKTSHLVVCVHGLDGNSADLRLVKTYLEMALPGAGLQFLMSEINQVDTFQSFEDMTRKLVNEIMYHVKTCFLNIGRISFIGHSLGTILIRSAVQKPELANFAAKFHTFLSLSGPHIGTMYNNSGLVNAGMWMMQKWKKSGSLQQLALKDTADIRASFMYRLAERSNLHLFKHVLLAGSSQDKYVPIHSARVELCKAAVKDQTVTGAAYREMVHHILDRVIQSDTTALVRYDIHHALANNTNSLIGRAAHIAVLDSELFIEKFLVIAVLKYFQ